MTVWRALLLRHAPRLFLRLAAPDRGELGACGEELAARALRALGWRVLARRLATPACELDIVALDGATLVAVEVKTSRRPALPRLRGSPAVLQGTRWRPGERLDAGRLARQRRAVRWLAARRPGPRAATRVDLVEVWVSADGRDIRLALHADLRAALPHPRLGRDGPPFYGSPPGRA